MSFLHLPLALVGLLAPSSVADDEYTELLPDAPQRALISVLQEEYPTWRIEVPGDVTAMRLWTTGATDDLDLYLSSEFPADPDLDYADRQGLGIWLDEELLITVSDAVPLYEGQWFVTLAPGQASLEPDRVTSIRATLHVEFPEPVQATLPPDELVDLTITRDHGLRAVLALPEDFAPPKSSTWRIELYCPNGDADLLVGPRPISNALYYPYNTSSSTIGYEEVTFRGHQARNLQVHAFGLPEYDYLESLDLRLRLSEVVEGSRPPSILPPLVLPPSGGDARAKALAGTVAIFGNLGAGTGTLLSETGLVVTNAHVVVSPQAQAPLSGLPKRFSRGYYAGFNDDPRLPASPDVSLELLDYREDLDLALLAITGTLDGHPLPEGARFPAIELGSTTEIQLGDELFALGYPMTGGDSSMTTISLTRGICSGFAESLEGPSIKTDAGIHSGISGGALLDSSWRLIGVPSATITDTNFAGGLGFAIPVESFPASWRELALRPQLDDLRDALRRPAGSHEPLAVGGLDRISWSLIRADVRALIQAGAGSHEVTELEARLSSRAHDAVPALLNGLEGLDLDDPKDRAAGARCLGLLLRLTHDERSAGTGDAAAMRATLEQLAEAWERVQEDPTRWIELARLDQPGHASERARFDALLTARPSRTR
ncbi:MAG: serine protease [Planctomycetota bacterium]|nr:serine protease [Planctomycetota bacterium]